jgi:hypothetical protein
VNKKARTDFIKELNRSGELVVVDSKDLTLDVNTAKTADGLNKKPTKTQIQANRIFFRLYFINYTTKL